MDTILGALRSHSLQPTCYGWLRQSSQKTGHFTSHSV